MIQELLEYQTQTDTCLRREAHSATEAVQHRRPLHWHEATADQGTEVEVSLHAKNSM